MEYGCEGPDCGNKVVGDGSRLGWLVLTHMGPHGVDVYDFCSWACTIRFAGDLDTHWEPVKAKKQRRVKSPHLRDAIQPELPGVLS